MNTLIALKSAIAADSDKNGISKDNLLKIALIPWVVILIYTVLLIIPITRDAAIWGTKENRPVELITFFFTIAGGILGLTLAWQIKQRRRSNIAFYFYLIFAIGFLFVGAEEVAWGQWFLGFETPEALENINAQGELTLHNIDGMQERLEILPLTFGIAGLIGVWLNQSKNMYFRQLGASYALLPWFVIITVVSAIDLFQDFVVIHEQFDHLINHLDEVIEMLISLAGFIYIWLNKKKFALKCLK